LIISGQNDLIREGLNLLFLVLKMDVSKRKGKQAMTFSGMSAQEWDLQSFQKELGPAKTLLLGQ
jgi:hypothetical protein